MPCYRQAFHRRPSSPYRPASARPVPVGPLTGPFGRTPRGQLGFLRGDAKGVDPRLGASCVQSGRLRVHELADVMRVNTRRTCVAAKACPVGVFSLELRDRVKALSY